MWAMFQFVHLQMLPKGILIHIVWHLCLKRNGKLMKIERNRTQKNPFWSAASAFSIADHGIMQAKWKLKNEKLIWPILSGIINSSIHSFLHPYRPISSTISGTFSSPPAKGVHRGNYGYLCSNGASHRAEIVWYVTRSKSAKEKWRWIRKDNIMEWK